MLGRERFEYGSKRTGGGIKRELKTSGLLIPPNQGQHAFFMEVAAHAQIRANARNRQDLPAVAASLPKTLRKPDKRARQSNPDKPDRQEKEREAAGRALRAPHQLPQGTV